MEDIHFNWVSNELLTKKRMDQFTDFMHQRFGYMHTLNNGDYGFGLMKGQKIENEQNNNQLKISLPAMPIVFPHGFLIVLKEQIDLGIEYRNGLLCLGVSNDRMISLQYFANEKEACDHKCLPLLHTAQANFLMPVLNIREAAEYEVIRKSLNQHLATCIELINKYLLNSSDTGITSSVVLRNLVFSSYLSAMQQIKLATISNSHPGTCSYFSLFKVLLLLTESFSDYFDKIDVLHGIQNKYSNRENQFIQVLAKLMNDINSIHFNDNIRVFDKWLEDLSNLIKVYTMKNEAGGRDSQEASESQNLTAYLETGAGIKAPSENTPRSRQLL